MHPLRLSQLRRILELKYDVSVLELELQAAKDDLQESSTPHMINMMSFVIQQKELDIKKKKYDITHLESILHQGNLNTN